jgi:hypothetical protein
MLRFFLDHPLRKIICIWISFHKLICHLRQIFFPRSISSDTDSTLRAPAIRGSEKAPAPYAHASPMTYHDHRSSSSSIPTYHRNADADYQNDGMMLTSFHFPRPSQDTSDCETASYDYPNDEPPGADPRWDLQGVSRTHSHAASPYPRNRHQQPAMPIHDTPPPRETSTSPLNLHPYVCIFLPSTFLLSELTKNVVSTGTELHLSNRLSALSSYERPLAVVLILNSPDLLDSSEDNPPPVI